MQKDITITILPKDEKNDALKEKLCKAELKKLGINENEKTALQFEKKSIDARHGNVKIHLRYKVFVGEDGSSFENRLPEWKNVSLIPENNLKKVVVIGSGPAGLFASLKLLEKGIKPLIIEQGKETNERKLDIEKISSVGKINEFSNYCFGEGGAGTFSDGKLYTRSTKRGNIPEILKIFEHFGADKNILTDSHPHIGTEKLPNVINNIKSFIEKMGGKFYFNSKVTDFIIENGNARGIVFENVVSGEKTSLNGDAIILAAGHSAYDIYNLLAKKSSECLEAKTFALGVRVEHPRSLIDSIQYHGKTDGMEAAEYRLTTQIDGRGVYSFCMCPGGFVVPSSSSEDEIVVNGMSKSGRNSKWSNSAIVVETRPDDILERFRKEAEEKKCPSLSGLYFRKWLEKETKNHGEGQKAPSQVLTDFLSKRKSTHIPKTSFAPGIISSNLTEWLPPQISERLLKAFGDFEKKMRGFVTDKAVLIASETRTSTPVRILRDKESGECVSIKNLYPCGEGSGYSGGIVSSAIDGEKVANKIAEKLL